MSKRSRTFRPSESRAPQAPSGGQPAGANQDVSSASTGATPTPVTPAVGGTSRAEVRRRASPPRVSQPQSFFDRYKVLILGGGAVAIIAIGLFAVLSGTSTNAYECVTLLTPPPADAPASSSAPGSAGPTIAPSPSSAPASSLGPVSSARPTPSGSTAPAASGSPAPSAAPSPTPLLGFATQDLGREHVGLGTSVRYSYCPPASGKHYNVGGQAPLPRRVYGPTDHLVPGNWIHNLEHGDVVILYKGDPGPQVLEELRAVQEGAAPSDWSLANCGQVNKVVVVRFDDMDPGVAFAAVAWDRALLLSAFDKDQLLEFANQWQDGPQTPERIC